MPINISQIHTYFGPTTQSLPLVAEDVQKEVYILLRKLSELRNQLSGKDINVLNVLEDSTSLFHRMLFGLLCDMIGSFRACEYVLDAVALENCALSMIRNIMCRLPNARSIETLEFEQIKLTQRGENLLQNTIYKHLELLQGERIITADDGTETLHTSVWEINIYNLCFVSKMHILSILDTCSDNKKKAENNVLHALAQMEHMQELYNQNKTIEEYRKKYVEANAEYRRAYNDLMDAVHADNEARELYHEMPRQDHGGYLQLRDLTV